MRVVVEVALPSLLAVKLLMLAMVVAVVADQISRFSVADDFSGAALEALFASVEFAASSAALVTFGGSTNEVYLVLNNGIAGYSAATDGVIRIRSTGTLDGFAIV